MKLFIQHPLHGTPEIIEFPDNIRFFVVTQGLIQPGDKLFNWMDNNWTDIVSEEQIGILFGENLNNWKVAGRVVIREF